MVANWSRHSQRHGTRFAGSTMWVWVDMDDGAFLRGGVAGQCVWPATSNLIVACTIITSTL